MQFRLHEERQGDRMDGNERMRERARILLALEQTKGRLALALDADVETAGTDGQTVSWADGINPLLEECGRLEAAYLVLLPKIPLSRCPFTGEIVYKTVDVFGLDGVWWEYANPIRPEETMPSTYLGFTGSLHVTNPLPPVSFTVMPGPSHPYVIPALLSMPEVRAVLSAVSIGGNTGHIVTWFVGKDRTHFMPPNEWGAPWCDAWDGAGQPRRGPSPFLLPDFDTDLASWLRSGKLFWIAPGDTSLLLRADVDACPYLRLEGSGLLQFITSEGLESYGMTEADMRKENMSPEEFAEAMRFLDDEGDDGDGDEEDKNEEES